MMIQNEYATIHKLPILADGTTEEELDDAFQTLLEYDRNQLTIVLCT